MYFSITDHDLIDEQTQICLAECRIPVFQRSTETFGKPRYSVARNRREAVGSCSIEQANAITCALSREFRAFQALLQRRVGQIQEPLAQPTRAIC